MSVYLFLCQQTKLSIMSEVRKDKNHNVSKTNGQVKAQRSNRPTRGRVRASLLVKVLRENGC